MAAKTAKSEKNYQDKPFGKKITTKDAQKLMKGVSHTTINRHILSGKIRAEKTPDGSYNVSENDVIYMRDNPSPSGRPQGTRSDLLKGTGKIQLTPETYTKLATLSLIEKKEPSLIIESLIESKFEATVKKARTA